MDRDSPCRNHHTGVVPRATDHTAVAAAMRLLQIDLTMEWAQMQRQYRDRVRAAHPDLATDTSDATVRTADLTVAWQLLADATDHGRVPLPRPPPPAPVSLEPVITLHAPPGDVYVQLLDAAYEIGDVTYMDPEAGLIQVLLSGAPTAARLLISIDTETEPPSASFTLDAMQESTAPHIHDVVARLGDALRAQ